MKPNYDEAVRFLETLQPEGPWDLCAIDPKPSDKQRSFYKRCENAHQVSGFLSHYQAAKQCGIYYQPNRPPLGWVPAKKKSRPGNPDIEAQEAFYADVDPVEEETKQEMLARVNVLLAKGDVPQPTAVVDSGNGVQLLWCLKKPISYMTDAHRDQMCEITKTLQVYFDGDAHAVDPSRLLRLPGTVNYPNDHKKSKGYQPVMATVLEQRPERYNISDFPAPERLGVTFTVDKKTEKLRTELGLDFVDETCPIVPLTANQLRQMPQHTREIANNEVETSHGNDRSRVCYRVASDLWREGFDADFIAGALMTPELWCAGHVLEHPSEAKRLRAAWRCVNRAQLRVIAESIEEQQQAEENLKNQEAAEKEAVAQVEQESKKRAMVAPTVCVYPEDVNAPEYINSLNQRYAFLSHGTKGLVLDLTDLMDPQRQEGQNPFLTPASFQMLLCQRVVVRYDRKGNPIKEPLGKAWLESPFKRHYHRMVFDPSETHSPTTLNYWTGLPVQPEQGNLEPYLDFVFRTICSERQECYDYLMNWMARAVQTPAGPGQVIVVVNGVQGTGKGLFVEGFARLFGRFFMSTNTESIATKFNGALSDKILVHIDEATMTSKIAATLKILATERTFRSEKKGLDATSSQNNLKLVMSTNESWVAPVEDRDRRYFIVTTAEDHVGDLSYFKQMYDFIRSPQFAPALMHYLMQRDLSGFRVYDFPNTFERREQIQVTRAQMSKTKQVLYDMLQRGWFYLDENQVPISEEPSLEILRAVVNERIRNNSGKGDWSSALRELYPETQKKMPTIVGDQIVTGRTVEGVNLYTSEQNPVLLDADINDLVVRWNAQNPQSHIERMMRHGNHS